MAEEESPVLRPGEEHDIMQLLADQAADRAEQIMGSHLWRVRCSTGCGRKLLATVERAATALCGACRMQEVSRTLGSLPEHLSAPDVSARFASPWVDVPLAVQAHPAPLVTSVDPWPGTVAVPAAVLKLEQSAREASWEVRHTYARGFGVKKYRGAWQEEESIAVRFGAHPLSRNQAVAVYRTIAGRGSWSWVSVWMWGLDIAPFGHAGITELMEWLDEGVEMSPTWYAGIRARRQGQAARSKPCRVDCAVAHEHKRPARKKAREV